MKNKNTKHVNKEKIPTANTNQSFEWLLKNNRSFALKIAKIAPKINNNYLEYAARYHDLELLEIALKKGEKIDNNNATDLVSTSLLSKMNYQLIEESKPYLFKEKVNLNYNFLFLEKFFSIVNHEIKTNQQVDTKENSNNFSIVGKKINKHDSLLDIIVSKFSDSMSSLSWKENKERNNKQFVQLTRLLQQYNYYPQNKDKLMALPLITKKFNRLEQWEIFLEDENILSYNDMNNNNFLHYLFSYIDHTKITPTPEESNAFEYVLDYIYSKSIFSSPNNALNNHMLIVGTTGQGRSRILEEISTGPIKWLHHNTMYCDEVLHFLENYVENLSHLPEFPIAIQKTNNDNQTPLDMSFSQLAVSLKSKLLEKSLNKKETPSLKRNKL